jgi:hypothetical protein
LFKAAKMIISTLVKEIADFRRRLGEELWLL